MKRVVLAALLGLSLTPVAPAAAGESARSLYTRTLARERTLRDARNTPTLQQLRAVVAAYERLVQRFPSSGYSDNALWQGGNLALLAHDRFHQDVDRRTAERLLTRLKTEYSASSLVARIEAALAESAPASADGDSAKKVPGTFPGAPTNGKVPGTFSGGVPPGGTGAVSVSATENGPAPIPVNTRGMAELDAAKKVPGTFSSGVVTIRDIKRTPIDDGMRVTVEMDGESLYHSEKVENPERVFFDLKGTRAVAGLQDRTLKFQDDVVREIRLGRHPQNTTRIVMDMNGVESYSVFTLYNPFRLVIDFRRAAAPAPLVRARPEGRAYDGLMVPPRLEGRASDGLKTAAAPLPAELPVTPVPPAPAPSATTGTVPPSPAIDKVPLVSRQPAAPLAIPPSVPATNSNGQFSLARQLGLGISRVVIDAGHGGHDPGAQSNGVTESELVLDIALRLRKLIEKQTGIDVTMTRDTDVFVPLEERTAIANREAADLFLSIHANASRNARARGVETYFLNFATNPEAEAVAARENSASGRTMHNLPDIVKAIALNNKIDESRDFAGVVQRSMVTRLAQRNKQVKDLGVKQAPFVVLIGAGMPSVLAEISFVTNRQEGQLLKTGAYRQQIAQALMDAILRYQHSLKKMTSVARTTDAR
jgi:N-acetylmuramoyl-L-alanine amidase